MTSDMTEEQEKGWAKRVERNFKEECLRMAIDSKVAQTSEQLIDTTKKIYEFLNYEDK